MRACYKHYMQKALPVALRARTCRHRREPPHPVCKHENQRQLNSGCHAAQVCYRAMNAQVMSRTIDLILQVA